MRRINNLRRAPIKKELKGSYKNFEETFRILLEKAKQGPLSIKTLLTILSGKGKVLLLIFLCLGFGQIPGISIFLGLVIVYLGLRLSIGANFIWMPKKLLNKKIPSYFLIKVIKQILHFLKFMKRWSSPRYLWATQHSTTRVVNGLMIALVGASLAISPPVPLSGLTAFVAIFAIAIGILNDDGIYILIGYFFAFLYFATVFCLLKFCSISQLFNLFSK